MKPEEETNYRNKAFGVPVTDDGSAESSSSHYLPVCQSKAADCLPVPLTGLYI